MIPQPAITCSKLTIETQEQSVKYVQVNNKDTRTTVSIPTKNCCVKNVRVQSFPGLYFSAFGLNTQVYSANLTK